MRLLGVPSIASVADRRRVATADSFVVGGFVCVLSAALRIAGVYAGAIGVVLFLCGGWIWIQAIRCPRCGDRWAWRSVSKHRPRQGALWLASLKTCPACSYAPEPIADRPQLSSELRRAMHHAAAAAQRESSDITSARLLLEILESESVVSLLRGLGTDLDALKQAVSGSLPLIHPAAQGKNGSARFTEEARKCLNRAATQVASSDSAEITCPLVLLMFLCSVPDDPIRAVLERAGLARYAMQTQIAHGPDVQLDPPSGSGSTVTIQLHNDPFTTREFVRTTLQELFGFDEARAEALVAQIHENGFGAVVTLPEDVALERVAELRRRAIAEAFPLRVTFDR